MANLRENLVETREVAFWIVEQGTDALAKRGNIGIIEGPCMTLDEINENGREYPSENVTPTLDALNSDIQENGYRAMAMDHPDPNGQGASLKDTAAGLCGVRREGKEVYLRAVVPNSTYGRDMLSFADAGIRIPVSLRGSGSLVQESRGGRSVKVVQSDFQLETFDFVTTPGFAKAAIKHLRESRQLSGGEMDMPTDLEKLRKDNPAEYARMQEHFETELDPKFNAVLIDNVEAAVAKQRESIAKQERDKLIKEERTAIQAKLLKEAQSRPVARTAPARVVREDGQMPANVDQHIGVTGSAYLSTPDQIRKIVAQLGYPVGPLNAMSDDELTDSMSNWISGGLAGRNPATMQNAGSPAPVDQNLVTVHTLPEAALASDALNALLEQMKRQQVQLNQLVQERQNDNINGLFESEIQHKPTALRDELRAKWSEDQLNAHRRCRTLDEMKAYVAHEERWLKRMAAAVPESNSRGPNIFTESLGAESAGPMKLDESLAAAADSLGLGDYLASQTKN